ncbi:MAG: type III-B CRISPR module-associated protein Cmr5 [Anaerolineae bacterium]
MSGQPSLEQRRANYAWQRIDEVKKKGFAKKYGQLARGAPADVQTNGLGQTLAFWRANGFKAGKAQQNEHAQLLQDVSRWVMEERFHWSHEKGLLGWITGDNATTDGYRQATVETLALLVWLKRFAEAELGEEK